MSVFGGFKHLGMHYHGTKKQLQKYSTIDVNKKIYTYTYTRTWTPNNDKTTRTSSRKQQTKTESATTWSIMELGSLPFFASLYSK